MFSINYGTWASYVKEKVYFQPSQERRVERKTHQTVINIHSLEHLFTEDFVVKCLREIFTFFNIFL